ncbi:MAG: hypothetical protein JWO31_462 [Phycisphaerales bacterium]|nr:hypothetical protein [Phycisphaerales bacterium]
MRSTLTLPARRAAAALCSLLLAPALASAGAVDPGQSIPVDSVDLMLPAGSALAETSSAFAIDYAATDRPTAGTLKGVLRSAVYDVGGSLTFVYDVDVLDAAGFSEAAERSELTVSSFAKAKTAVTGGLDFEALVRASRSADGSRITLASDTPGLGGPPVLIVKTDATTYDAGGRATFAVADEVSGPYGQDWIAGGTASIAGLLRPTIVAAPVDPAPSAGPTPIPLPPAAYSGLGVMLAMGLIAATRRVWDVKKC